MTFAPPSAPHPSPTPGRGLTGRRRAPRGRRPCTAAGRFPWRRTIAPGVIAANRRFPAPRRSRTSGRRVLTVPPDPRPFQCFPRVPAGGLRHVLLPSPGTGFSSPRRRFPFSDLQERLDGLRSHHHSSDRTGLSVAESREAADLARYCTTSLN